jgi:hypothetical protein
MKRLSPAEQARANKIRAYKRDYDTAIGDILGDEDDFGTTDASVKKAIRYAHSWRGTGPKMPGDEAAISYLSDKGGRGSEISEARYKRLDAEITDEENQRKKSMAGTFGFDPMEKFKSAESDQKTAAYMKDHVKPMIDAASREIANAISRAIGAKPTNVVVDGNPIAKSNGNATDRRRR